MKMCLSSALFVSAGLTIGGISTANAAIVGDALYIYTNNGTAASITIPVASLTYDTGALYYDMASPMVLSNGVIIESFNVSYNDSVYFGGGFEYGIAINLVAKTEGLATTFQVVSGSYLFGSALSNQVAVATGDMTLTGYNSTAANVVGQNAGGFAHSAAFNTGAFYSNISSLNVAGANGTNVDGGITGPDPVVGPVTSMNVQWAFSAEAYDSVSLNSNFAITPAPSALALLGLGGLMGARRRR